MSKKMMELTMEIRNLRQALSEERDKQKQGAVALTAHIDDLDNAYGKWLVGDITDERLSVDMFNAIGRLRNCLSGLAPE